MDQAKHRALSWGSHRPLLQVVLARYQPASIVECGCGLYSTPLFSAMRGAEVWTFEHDASWFDQMRKTCGEGPRHHWVLEALPWTEALELTQMNEEQRQLVQTAYCKLRAQYPQTNLDLLFVDTFNCARQEALRTFGELARRIVVHDVEWYNAHKYGYGEYLAEHPRVRYRLTMNPRYPHDCYYPCSELWLREELSAAELEAVRQQLRWWVSHYDYPQENLPLRDDELFHRVD